MKRPMLPAYRRRRRFDHTTALAAAAGCIVHTLLCSASAVAAPAAVNNLDLAQLLPSNPWCFQRQNKTTGESYTTQFRFSQNGTYIQEIQSTPPSSGINGKQVKPKTVHTTGRWVFRNGLLMIAAGKGELKPVNLTVRRDANGASIIGADQVDYSKCR
jgi:hypothetical protein